MRFDIREDSAGEWRWSAVGDNGEITAQSESYTRKSDAFRAARDFAVAIVKQVTGSDYVGLDIEQRMKIESVLNERETERKP